MLVQQTSDEGAKSGGRSRRYSVGIRRGEDKEGLRSRNGTALNQNYRGQVELRHLKEPSFGIGALYKLLGRRQALQNLHRTTQRNVLDRVAA